MRPLYIFDLDGTLALIDMWRSLGVTCFQVAPGDF